MSESEYECWGSSKLITDMNLFFQTYNIWYSLRLINLTVFKKISVDSY